MKEIVHILINDEEVDIDSSDPTVFSFFDNLKKPFIQIKNAKQFEYLTSILPDNTEIAVWVHPNADMKKSDNIATPGEISMSSLGLDDIEFNIISRYPDDVSKELLKDLGKNVLKLGGLYKEIKNVKTSSVGSIKNKGKDYKINNPSDEVVEIAIIAALYDDEFTSLEEFLEDKKPVVGSETMMTAKLKDSDKRVLVDFQTKMGMVEATYLSTQIMTRFSPKYIIMIGVCGGRASKNINLLDIIIPNKVFDYQTGNYYNGVFKPYLRSCNINNKKAISASQSILASMLEYVNTPLKSKCKNINILGKTLACGNVVVKTDGYLEDTISKFDEETQGVEMESFGVVRAAELIENKKVTPIIIKSVMDFTEKNKNDKDKANAAYFSACFTYFLIKDHL